MSFKNTLASLLVFVSVVGAAQDAPATSTSATSNSTTTAAPVQNDQMSLDNGTIDSQFDYVINKSNKYEDYKVVKKTWLDKLKSHTIDTLKAVKKDLIDTQGVVSNQELEIKTLKSNLAQTKSDLDQTLLEKDSMSIFGMLISKSSYNGLIFTIIGILILLLGFFIYRFNNSNAVTKESKKALVEMEEEFAEHRKRALEREQKVMRQLQDELNKKKKASK